MKPNITKNILQTNIAIIAIIYIFSSFFDAGVIYGFFLTWLQIIFNTLAAIIIFIIHLSTKRKNPELGKIMNGYAISVGLVILISFPTCLLVGTIHPLRFLH